QSRISSTSSGASSAAVVPGSAGAVTHLGKKRVWIASHVVRLVAFRPTSAANAATTPPATIARRRAAPRRHWISSPAASVPTPTPFALRPSLVAVQRDDHADRQQRDRQRDHVGVQVAPDLREVRELGDRPVDRAARAPEVVEAERPRLRLARPPDQPGQTVEVADPHEEQRAEAAVRTSRYSSMHNVYYR